MSKREWRDLQSSERFREGDQIWVDSKGWKDVPDLLFGLLVAWATARRPVAQKEKQDAPKKD